MCYSDRKTKRHAITPRGAVPPLHYSCRNEGTIPSASSSFFLSLLLCAETPPPPNNNDRGCKDVFCNVHKVKEQ